MTLSLTYRKRLKIAWWPSQITPMVRKLVA